MSFRISALPAAPFAPFFLLSDEALTAKGGVLRVADRAPGFPCRVSLRDAEPGETLLLVNYEHQPARTPFRATHAVYVRRGAEQAHLEPGEVPDMLRLRLLSLRSFDANGMLIDADVVEGRALETLLQRMLGAPEADYVHLHFARPGCYAARADRC